MNIGTRRAGFEKLRDLVTAYRRAWSTRYLDNYLRALWENEIRSAARAYSRHLEVKRKAPTPKQFAKIAEDPTNHWFGGDLSLLYAAFGEKSPIVTRRVNLLIDNPEDFAVKVFYALGGTRIDSSGPTYTEHSEELDRSRANWAAHWNRKGLAESSVRYVQLREAFGRPPTITEFGRSKFEHLGTILNEDPTRAWEIYSNTIETLLRL
jgi:hypothetical protein